MSKKQPKTVLITGASKGIGKEFAKVFSQKGFDLVLVARSKDKLTQVKNECKTLSNTITAISSDLTQPDIAKKLFATLKKKGIVVDILINNAGFGEFGEFAQSNINKQHEMITLNITALTELTYEFLQQVNPKKSSHIVNLGSVASFVPGPLMSVYFATKAYVLSFSEALSIELANSNTAVTCICPGPTQSEFTHAAEMGEFVNAPTAKELVDFAYEKIKEKKVVAIHGAQNQSLAFLPRILPRSAVREIVKKRMYARKN